MDQQQIIDLMKSSKSETEWDANCDKVKKTFGGYPNFWFTAIVASGVMKETVAKFGKSADIQIANL